MSNRFRPKEYYQKMQFNDLIPKQPVAPKRRPGSELTRARVAVSATFALVGGGGQNDHTPNT